MAVRGDFSNARVSFSNEAIAAIIKDRQEPVFEDERTACSTRQSQLRATRSGSLSTDLTGRIVSSVFDHGTYRTRRGALRLANGVISILIKNQAFGQKEKALQARIEQLKIRPAALRVHAPVPPTAPALPLRIEIIDMATAPMRPEFPRRLAFCSPRRSRLPSRHPDLALQTLPLIYANSRRRGRAAHGRAAQARPHRRRPSRSGRA